jgi:hypothetical protein
MLAAPDLSALRIDVELPIMHRARQRFDRPTVDDIEGTVRREVRRFADRVRPGMRVGITAGSRGIANIPRLLEAAGAELRELGAKPFIIPAMGSHGGATAEGQIGMLRELGVTEQSTGLEIVSSMEVREIGRLENGMPVFASVTALEADGVVVLARVKPHTDFNGPIESGLAKMCGIGLGKQHGAQTIHSYGVPGLARWMPEAAKVIVKQTGVVFGLAVVENAYDETAVIEAVPPEGIAGPDEERLQAKAKSLMASLPFDTLDVLVVDEMGKEISGAGMDTNVIGRMMVYGSDEYPRPKVVNIAVLELTEASHGNASGLGLADFTTQRLVEHVDFAAFYINALTAGVSGVQRGQVPMILPTDRAAISAAIRACGEPDPSRVGVVHIKNTLQVGEIELSASLLEQAKSIPHLDVDPDGRPMAFSEDGRIADVWRQAVHA